MMISLKQLMPYRPRAPPIVRDGQGRAASTSAELSQMWHSHFAAKLGADDITYEQLAREHAEQHRDSMD
eukprot:11624768-Alexandrium_andersonii.AAC.1